MYAHRIVRQGSGGARSGADETDESAFVLRDIIGTEEEICCLSLTISRVNGLVDVSALQLAISL